MRDAGERESAGGPAGPEGRAFAAAVADEARTEAAQLFNVDAEDVLITHGTSEGVAIALFGLDWQPGDVLLTTDLEHPGINSPVAVLEEQGVEIRRVSVAPDASADSCIEAFRSGLDSRVKVAALSHVMFTTGLRVPADEIVAAAHDVGAMVLLDGAQTAGHIAMDFAAMGIDFYASSGQKWLMGPTGSGAFYVRPDRRELLKPLLRQTGAGFRSGLGQYSLASQGVAERAGYAEAVRINRELGPGKRGRACLEVGGVAAGRALRHRWRADQRTSRRPDGVRHHCHQRGGLGAPCVRRCAVGDAPDSSALRGTSSGRALLHGGI